MHVIIHLGLGSNMGDRESHLDRAASAVAQLPGVVGVRMASLYETAPVGPVEQGPFLNTALEVLCACSPQAMQAGLKEVERAAGREPVGRRVFWGPRPLDIDILLWGAVIMKTPELEIPHPRLRERAFVLVPLLELAPDLLWPLTGELLADDLGKLDPQGVRLWRAAGGS